MQYIIPKNMNIESSNEELYNNDKIKISLDASINMRIMLADILNYGENILITEDNIDNTLEIIEKENLKTGIYIEKNSQEMFIKLLNEIFGDEYFEIVNDYLQLAKEYNIRENENIFKLLKSSINSNEETLIISISDSYKDILNDGSILDFMIERTYYTKNFNYNNHIKVSIINLEKILEKLEDISVKEQYEEILISIFQ